MEILTYIFVGLAISQIIIISLILVCFVFSWLFHKAPPHKLIHKTLHTNQYDLTGQTDRQDRQNKH